MQTRREFCRMIGLLGAGLAINRRTFSSPLAWADPKTHFTLKPVPGGGFVIGAIDDGGNVLVLPSETGPIIIDAKFAHTALDLRNDIQALFSKKPALLINTHHHADHSGGNWIFQDDVKITAHKNFNPRI